MRHAPATRLVRSATNNQDFEAVASIAAEAFCSLQAATWLVPESEPRMTIMTNVFKIWVRHARGHGQVDMLVQMPQIGGKAGRREIGAAVWFYRNHEIPLPVAYGHRLRAAAGKYANRFEVLGRLFDEHRPQRPHHHLALLAVVPRYQGTGAARALLQHHHAGLAFKEMPAYLTAPTPRNLDLFAAHGYRTHGQPFSIPNGAAFQPMWRTPYGIEGRQ
jgi:GNAT superfamily N-acetyltransferase